MTMQRRFLFPLLLLFLSGCMTDATVELTKAPFDATTQISNGFTRATGEFTQPLTEFTSSTTPGSWFTGDHPGKARQKVEVFTAYTFENLRTDISRGDGEYVTSLATLAGVPYDQHANFRHRMMSSYATLYDDRSPLRESAARIVETAWSAGRGRLDR